MQVFGFAVLRLCWITHRNETFNSKEQRYENPKIDTRPMFNHRADCTGGCSATAPLYVIDVQKPAGAEPDTAESLLREMVTCQLKHEERWEEEQTDVQDIIGKLDTRRYEIENGQIDRWQRKPMVKLYFDEEYEERVNGIKVDFIEQVSPTDALRQLGYSQKTLIEHRYSSDAWYFITQEYLHQIYLQDTGETTAVTIHLDALTH